MHEDGDSLGAAVLLLEVWLDGLVLRVEVGHVHHQVADDKHVRQRRNAGHLGGVPLHLQAQR